MKVLLLGFLISEEKIQTVASAFYYAGLEAKVIVLSGGEIPRADLKNILDSINESDKVLIVKENNTNLINLITAYCDIVDKGVNII